MNIQVDFNHQLLTVLKEISKNLTRLTDHLVGSTDKADVEDKKEEPRKVRKKKVKDD